MITVSGVILAGGGSVYWRKRNAEEAAERAKQEEIAGRQAEIQKLMDQLERETKEREQCQALVLHHQDAGLPAPECVSIIAEKTRCRFPGPAPKPDSVPRVKSPCNCQPGDPLCSCL